MCLALEGALKGGALHWVSLEAIFLNVKCLLHGENHIWSMEQVPGGSWCMGGALGKGCLGEQK